MEFSPRAMVSDAAEGIGAEPSPSPSPRPCNARILLDGNPITDQNRNVLVGELMRLTVECTDDPKHTLTGFRWSKPDGLIFKEYLPNADRAQRVDMGDQKDFNNETLQFRWTDAGDGRVIRVSFKVDGIESEAEPATLNVKAPEVQFTLVGFGATGLHPADQEVVRLNPAAGLEQGIECLVSVAIPAGFGLHDGKWNYTQLMNSKIYRRLVENGQWQKGSHFGNWVLDSSFPYDPDNNATQTPNQRRFRDMPSEPIKTINPPPGVIQRFPPITEKLLKDDFKLYILFKSDKPDSHYVPLRVLTWGWEFSASKATGAWAFTTQYGYQATNQYHGSITNTAEHPQWTNIWVKPNKYTNSDAPPP